MMLKKIRPSQSTQRILSGIRARERMGLMGVVLIAMHGDEVAESLMIEDELCKDIADTPPAEGIEIIRREEGGEEE